MEGLDDCSCTWYCSCKVLLGKRLFPEYLKLEEYKDFIKEKTKTSSLSSKSPEKYQPSSSSSWRSQRR